MNRNKLFTIVTVVGLFAIFISLIAMMVLTPSTKEKSSSLYKKETQALGESPLKISTDFVLKTTSNEKFDSKTLRGKFLFIYFGSTHCPNVCLPHLVKMKHVLNVLRKQQSDNLIKFIFITADPTQDTPAHLSSYFKNIDSRIIPLSGKKDEVNTVLKNFKVYKTLFGDKTEATHSGCALVTPSPFYFIGKDGDLIKRYNPHRSSVDIAKNISHYIKMS